MCRCLGYILGSIFPPLRKDRTCKQYFRKRDRVCARSGVVCLILLFPTIFHPCVIELSRPLGNVDRFIRWQSDFTFATSNDTSSDQSIFPLQYRTTTISR
ncbi:hypothetical protein BDZ94DRAFT_475035 [Collybia nuda]|uniref:Uncharacterized protein n=1 Tax=Collybia nuda TaxID=64659 RepID=A0A9P5Y946_9AGAR|nr:hypothetical protein BDZ94DRAFT_475035 [Collybia nuda]